MLRTLLCAAGITIGLLAGWVPSALAANNVTLDVLATDGTSDPAADVPRVFRVSGTATVPTRLFVKYRAPGGAACAPTAGTDTGREFSAFYNVPVGEGAFSEQLATTWEGSGPVVFCFWLAASSSTISAAPFTQTITFRSPTGAITATINPISPAINQQATITITGSSEAAAYVFATIRTAGGAPCAPTYQSDTGTGLVNSRSVNGSFSVSVTTTQSTAGNYLLCLWLADSGSDTTPIAGPQPQTFTVVDPAPPALPPPAALPPLTRVAASASLRRRGSRYSGRVTTRRDCSARRTVVLRRNGSGSRSFGRTLTRADGTYTFNRSRRLRGRVYVVAVSRRQGQTVCSVARSRTIRG